MPRVAVQLLHRDAKVPRYAHAGPYGDLAADLHSVAAVTVAPHATSVVSTGLAMGFPAEYGALIEDRSGLAVRGITTLAGVIDPGYRGEIKVILINVTDAPIALAAGDRVAQLRLVRRVEAEFVSVERLDDAEETLRGALGFGSTGA